MKKIIIMLISIFLLSGCADYVEINDLAIISGIAIDYENDLYKLTAQLIENDKESKVVVLTTASSSIDEAMSEISKLSNKELFISHLKVLILSDRLIKENKDFYDYFLRSSKSKMNFYTYIASKDEISSIFKIYSDKNSSSIYLDKMMDFNQNIFSSSTPLKFIDMIMEQIKLSVKKQHIEAEITGRAKHLYSIYRKMKRDNITLDQVYDLFALRVIVNSIKDCYAVLGIVHELYSPMPGRFKDYISVPKPNMYQSLHTTLIGPKGTPFEVQIRTWDMHRIAEYGIAAHWAYKEASFMGNKKANVKVEEDKLSWLRETLEWQKDMQDPDEFLNTLKTELFEDEVYVFTPKGKIIALPKGSTPIDFAYYIHAEIGNHMTGAKINSKMMPIVTQLKNGDIVEIITSDQSKGPSRDWLKFIKSSTAKNKILAWYKKNDREENIVKGKDLIEKEIKKIGMTHAEIAKSEYIQAALDRYKYSEVDEMYASVGFGAISAGKIVARMLEEYRKDHQTENLEEKLEVLSKDRAYKPKATKTGIIVKGIDNCLVKLSKCCNPVPGDEIVGYITKGRGVSVHRKDCANVNNLLSEENRMIDVYWYEAEKTRYSVDIEVYGNERSGLLADIIREIEGTKSKLLAVTSRANKEKISITEVTVEVENIEELNKILKQIRKVDSVYEVKRKK